MKEGKNIKTWNAHALAVTLLSRCKERKQDSGHAGNDADHLQDGTFPLASVIAEKSAFVHHCATFVGYLKAVSVLLKVALLHKPGEHFIIMGWKYSASVENVPCDSPSGCIKERSYRHIQHI